MKIYLLCGVPGSGKTWVAEQLESLFTYVRHDHFEKRCDLLEAIGQAIAKGEKNLIVDCPFDERTLRSQVEMYGFEVIPIFIVENLGTISARYQQREGKRPTKNILTRARTIMNKVVEWNAVYGTSEEILKHFKELAASDASP